MPVSFNVERMLRSIVLLSLLFYGPFAFAQKVSGTVFNDKGDLLPYASITVKGTSIGASANQKANFILSLGPGTFTLVCQHIGYTAQEKTVTISNQDQDISFVLKEQVLNMQEVVVKAGGEDPAYEIIRQAIKKRPYYNAQVGDFNCEMYNKDIIKLRNLPQRILGKEIPEQDRKEMGLDSTGKGIVYLSESVAKAYIGLPDKFKLEVISSRVSGTDGFGFTFPAFISLYKNNVTIFTDKFNPRGFVSPIADGAMRFYNYKFMGTFFEDGKAINAIKVTPKRKYEPLFTGTINITDGDWRIHSFDLFLTKTAQLEIMDTLQIKQLHVPIGNDVWRAKNQLLYFNLKQFKVDLLGVFQTVYSNYELNPAYSRKVFDRIFIKYDTAVNKRNKQYWDSIRPMPLEPEEIRDYVFKDSMYVLYKDSLYRGNDIDSLKKKQGGIKPLSILFPGLNRTHFSKKNMYEWGIESLLLHAQYNTAEGFVAEVAGYYEKYLRSRKAKLLIEPAFRYGFSNTHFNAWVNISLKTTDWLADKEPKRELWNIAGGKRVSQYNKENPIFYMVNTLSTLLYGNNFMKTYENYFSQFSFSKKYESGFNIGANVLYEDRLPIFNTTNYTFNKEDSIKLTENYPAERVSRDEIYRHQAVIVTLEMSFKPGLRYIQLPRTKIPVGSKYPLLSFTYSKAISGILGSDVNFDKWNFGISDDRNLKLAGTLKYKFNMGGFINDHKVTIQDYQHFNGNQSLAAARYVNSFQLANYYANSTTASFFATANIEHHFNGLLTNKIPLFKRLNWNLVAGANAFYVNEKNNYTELFFGLENIFKLLRVDYVLSFQNGKSARNDFVIGIGGLFGGTTSVNNNSSTMRGRSLQMSF
jgi:hypothetical protein